MPLPAEILHLPYNPGPYRMAMGLQACAPTALIEIDDACPGQLAERARLLATRRSDVLAATPGSMTACEELAAHLHAGLPAWFPDLYRPHPDGLENRLSKEVLDHAAMPPLEWVGRMVAEDFCLIRPSDAGALLVAAVLCFPARWVLAEKLGRPLLDVHERVPGYAEKLGAPVDRFMRSLKPGRVAMRLNWSISDDPALFQQSGKFRDGVDPSITHGDALEKLFLRVERQTFVLLPVSGTVAFGIRTHVTSLRRVVAIPDEAARLAGAVRALPAAMALYKSLGRFRDALLTALDREIQFARGRGTNTGGASSSD
jgi:hypothetical protein